MTTPRHLFETVMMTAGRGTNAVTVTAGAAGTMQIRVLVISELGMPGAASAAVTVTP